MPARTKTKRSAKSNTNRKPRKISRLRKPDDMSLEQWQVALRKQFGPQQNFKLKNVGSEPIFSDFEDVRRCAVPVSDIGIRGPFAGRGRSGIPAQILFP